MKVLAVDPGYDRLGIAVLEKNSGEEILIHSDCLQTDKSNSHTERLFYIGKIFESLLKKHKPDAVAVETLFFNKNQKTALGVSEARGIILFLATKSGCEIFEFGPQEIKVAVTGYGKSDKAAVVNMVRRLVKNAPKKALDDEYDAIAVGITCLAHHKSTT